MYFFFLFIRGFAIGQPRLYISNVGILHKKSANPNVDCAFFVIWCVFLLLLSLGNLEHVCVTDISSRAFYCSSYWQLPFSDCPFDCTDSLVSHTYRASISTYHKLLAKIPCVVFFIMPHISQLLGRVYLYPPKIKIKWCVISY